MYVGGVFVELQAFGGSICEIACICGIWAPWKALYGDQAGLVGNLERSVVGDRKLQCDLTAAALGTGSTLQQM